MLEVLNLPGEGEVFCLLVDRRSQLLQRRYLSSTGDRTTATTTPPTAAAATTMARLSLPLFFSSPPLVVVARSFQVFFAAVGDIEAARSLESRGRRRHSQCGPVEHRESERERAEAAFRSNERAATVVKGLSSSSSVAAAHSCTHTRYNSRNLMERGRDGGKEGGDLSGGRRARCRFLWVEDRFSMAADLAFRG